MPKCTPEAKFMATSQQSLTNAALLSNPAKVATNLLIHVTCHYNKTKEQNHENVYVHTDKVFRFRETYKFRLIFLQSSFPCLTSRQEGEKVGSVQAA